MRIDRLTTLADGEILAADLAIVGGGPAGLTIAEICARGGISVLVLESGLEAQDQDHEALNVVEIGESPGGVCAEERRTFHASLAQLWSHERQPFGVRCRGLGGSTQAWAGKSAIFDPIDFRKREWVENSGWPIAREELTPFIGEACELLNLCPTEPAGRFAGEQLVSFYWQFARSRVDLLDVVRFGREIIARSPKGVGVMLDATVTKIALDPAGAHHVTHLEAADSSDRRFRVEARHFVLAASAIENARLLLASNDVAPTGIGNVHDNVGRFMIDHAGTRIGHFAEEHIARTARQFGFYGMSHNGRAHMFMHGLALAPHVQESEGLLNAAVWFAPQRAPDDPWDALKRLLKGRSRNRVRDVGAVVKGSSTLARGAGMRALASPRLPAALKDLIVNSAIRVAPNLVVDEYESGGLPHKLSGLALEAITEQEPCRENRIALSDRLDRFGIPLPRAHWQIGDKERRTLLALARRTATELAAAGLPRPLLAAWVRQNRPEDARPIDLAHTMGTTRMSADPRTGVVDPHCRVHGIANLHVAGGSVLPTSGHANPTWMILAVACRLADRLKRKHF